MKYLDDYRERAADDLLERIRDTVTRSWTLMDACGAAHHLLRFANDRALPEGLGLVHGPGCPVCAMPVEALDRAIAVAAEAGVIFCTSGDLLRVPGRRGSLHDVRERHGDVRVVYSPLDALALAKKSPDHTVVFFAVGFETTAPTAAAAVREADRLGLANFVLLSAQVRMAPALAAVLEAPGHRAQAVLVAGHVGTVMGLREFEPLAERHRVPVIVTGSEPVDLLESILRAVSQLERGTHQVENQYERAVRPDGNPHARASIEAVFEPVDVAWRGLGLVPGCGLALRAQYRRFDAAARFPETVPEHEPASAGPPELPCREVVSGRLRPFDCPSFGSRCTTDRPLGAPMVSSEGPCAAYHRYRRQPRATVLDRPINDVVPTPFAPRGA